MPRSRFPLANCRRLLSRSTTAATLREGRRGAHLIWGAPLAVLVPARERVVLVRVHLPPHVNVPAVAERNFGPPVTCVEARPAPSAPVQDAPRRQPFGVHGCTGAGLKALVGSGHDTTLCDRRHASLGYSANVSQKMHRSASSTLEKIKQRNVNGPHLEVRRRRAATSSGVYHVS